MSTNEPHPYIVETKSYRRDLDEILQTIKGGSESFHGLPLRMNRERSLCVTKIQEAIMWLGMDLKAMHEEGIDGCENPYPESKNPKSPTIEKTADGLKL